MCIRDRSTIALYRLKSKPPASLSSSTYVCNKNAATSDKDTTPSTACELASTTTSRRTPGKLNASTTARNVSPRVHVCARGVGNARCGGGGGSATRGFNAAAAAACAAYSAAARRCSAVGALPTCNACATVNSLKLTRLYAVSYTHLTLPTIYSV